MVELESIGLSADNKGAIWTYRGKIIDPLNPDPSQIDIEDIAHALSNQCRFTGHTKKFYSVAQHSVLVSNICSDEHALWGLLHDASEAYLSDMARPIKKTDWGKHYIEAETDLMITISERFGLEMPIPDEVKYADNVLLYSEAKTLMHESFPFDSFDLDTPEIAFYPKSPTEAKHDFLWRYESLTSN